MQEDESEIRLPSASDVSESQQTSEFILTLNDGTKAILRLRDETRDLIQALGQNREIIGSWCTLVHEVESCTVEEGTIDGTRWVLYRFEHPQEDEEAVYNWNLGSSISSGSPWAALLPEGENQVVTLRYYHAAGKTGWIELILEDGSFYKLYPKEGRTAAVVSSKIEAREPISVGGTMVSLGQLLSAIGAVIDV